MEINQNINYAIFPIKDDFMLLCNDKTLTQAKKYYEENKNSTDICSAFFVRLL